MTAINSSSSSKNEYTIKVVDKGRKWKIIKSDGTCYKILATTEGLVCNCPSFKFRHTCKHIDLIVNDEREDDDSEVLTKEQMLEHAPSFVIHEHHSTNLHWDLRLQVNKVLFSWAIPKGLPEEKGIKRLALRMPGHGLSWLRFKGTIPDGEYGAGKVIIWEQGVYIPKQVTSTRFMFELHGKRLNGVWKLSKVEDSDTKWIITREK